MSNIVIKSEDESDPWIWTGVGEDEECMALDSMSSILGEKMEILEYPSDENEWTGTIKLNGKQAKVSVFYEDESWFAALPKNWEE